MFYITLNLIHRLELGYRIGQDLYWSYGKKNSNISQIVLSDISSKTTVTEVQACVSTASISLRWAPWSTALKATAL